LLSGPRWWAPKGRGPWCTAPLAPPVWPPLLELAPLPKKNQHWALVCLQWIVLKQSATCVLPYCKIMFVDSCIWICHCNECYSHVQFEEHSSPWKSKTPTNTASVSFQQWKYIWTRSFHCVLMNNSICYLFLACYC